VIRIERHEFCRKLVGGSVYCKSRRPNCNCNFAGIKEYFISLFPQPCGSGPRLAGGGRRDQGHVQATGKRGVRTAQMKELYQKAIEGLGSRYAQLDQGIEEAAEFMPRHQQVEKKPNDRRRRKKA